MIKKFNEYSINENKEFSEKEKVLRALLREFWYQAIHRNDMNKLKDSENSKRLNSKDFDLHFERFLKGELPEKIEDILN